MTVRSDSSGSNDKAHKEGLEDHHNWDRYRSYLHLIARANLGTVLRKKVDASDVVQQTLMQAYEKQDQFRGNDEPSRVAWLKVILRNKIIDFARHWHGALRDARREVEFEKVVDASIARVDDWLEASQTSPSQNVAKKEQLLQLPNALDQLEVELRQVVVMHHLQGMKLREIAEQVGCNETTVGRRLLRGLKQLNQLMQE